MGDVIGYGPGVGPGGGSTWPPVHAPSKRPVLAHDTCSSILLQTAHPSFATVWPEATPVALLRAAMMANAVT
jgi:hypothetical protein